MRHNRQHDQPTTQRRQRPPRRMDRDRRHLRQPRRNPHHRQPLHPPPTAGTRWDRWLAYTEHGRQRSADGRIQQLVADQYAPGYESGIEPAHATEDAMIISTGTDSAYTVEARTCGSESHPGWCELRIKLHDHVSGSAT